MAAVGAIIISDCLLEHSAAQDSLIGVSLLWLSLTRGIFLPMGLQATYLAPIVTIISKVRLSEESDDPSPPEAA